MIQQSGSVAISTDGNTAIIGVELDNSATGSAWVYTRSGNTWTQQGGKLVGSGAIGAAYQGSSVALSADGNTAIIGGPGDNDYAGATWVFTRSGNRWTQQGNKLIGAGATGTAQQGGSVALSGDGNTLVIGGPGSFSGGKLLSTWVFTRSSGVWTQQGNQLVGVGAGGNAYQSGDVAVSTDGNTAIIGGPGSDGPAVAWMFTRSGSVWNQQGELVGAGAVGFGGNAVALSGDGNTAIIGASGGDGTYAGAAFVFVRSSGVWTQQGGKLTGSDAVGGAEQGSAVALSADGNTAIICGLGDNASWVFTRVGGVWSQQGSKLVAAGGPVALSTDGSTAIIGSSGSTQVYVSVPPTAATPAITSIVNGASFTPGGAISPGSWVAIFGTVLAPAGDSRTWNPATEIVNGTFPLSLDGTSVTVNGKPVAVEFIQQTQVNIQTPDDPAVGPVQVVVNTATGTSNSFTANYTKIAPGLFPGTSPYIVAQHADNSYVTTATPAKAGEVIILWGTGFGPANPVVPSGQVFSGATPLANVVTVTIGGQPGAVDFAGVVGAGLVQINVHVPSSISNGDAAVVASVGGVSTQTTANMISIHN